MAECTKDKTLMMIQKMRLVLVDIIDTLKHR